MAGEKKRMTYGALLRQIGKDVGRKQTVKEPLKPVAPTDLGARIASLEEMAKKGS